MYFGFGSPLAPSSRVPLRVPRKERILGSSRFPEHCRTSAGESSPTLSNSPHQSFPVVALSAGVSPSRLREIGERCPVARFGSSDSHKAFQMRIVCQPFAQRVQRPAAHRFLAARVIDQAFRDVRELSVPRRRRPVCAIDHILKNRKHLTRIELTNTTTITEVMEWS